MRLIVELDSDGDSTLQGFMLCLASLHSPFVCSLCRHMASTEKSVRVHGTNVSLLPRYRGTREGSIQALHPCDSINEVRM